MASTIPAVLLLPQLSVQGLAPDSVGSWRRDGSLKFTEGRSHLLSNLTPAIFNVLITWDLIYTVDFGYHKPD